MAFIAILGYGTIGSGVFEVVHTNRAILEKKAGQEIRIKYVLDLRDFPGEPVQEVLTHDFTEILEDSSISVIVETMGGTNPAYSFVKQALQKGIAVVTSNKELVAVHGRELLSIAKEKRTNFLFEASTGGAIPIIRPLMTSFTADRVVEISGILNGTTNYILTKMEQEDRDFGEVLREAQMLGYAEKEPSADVEGMDTARKIAILTSIAYGKTVPVEKIQTEGICNITKRDILYAKEMNHTIKLIALSRRCIDGFMVVVAPMLLPKSHPLAMVQDVYNGIFVKGDMAGDIMFYGRGAGKLPTASAVTADVVDAIKHAGVPVSGSFSAQELPIILQKEAPGNFLVRIATKREREVEEKAGLLFENGKILRILSSDDELAVITGMEPEGQLLEKIEELKKDSAVLEVRNCIRIEGFAYDTY